MTDLHEWMRTSLSHSTTLLRQLPSIIRLANNAFLVCCVRSKFEALQLAVDESMVSATPDTTVIGEGTSPSAWMQAGPFVSVYGGGFIINFCVGVSQGLSEDV